MAKSEVQVERFEAAPDDPLAAEHSVVAELIEDACHLNRGYPSVDLKRLPNAKRFLDADAEQSRRYVLAAVKQCQHWKQVLDRGT